MKKKIEMAVTKGGRVKGQSPLFSPNVFALGGVLAAALGKHSSHPANRRG